MAKSDLELYLAHDPFADDAPPPPTPAASDEPEIVRLAKEVFGGRIIKVNRRVRQGGRR
jgi:hypothetical protein